MILVRCDFESLYTSIKHQDGLEAVQFFLMTSDLEKEFGYFILQLLNSALSQNFSCFGIHFICRHRERLWGHRVCPHMDFGEKASFSQTLP